MCVQILCFPRENYSNFVSPNIHSMSFHAVDVDVSHRVPFRYAIRQQLHLKMTASPSGNTAATKAKKSYKNQKPHSKHCVARWKFSECFKCFVRASAALCFCLLASRNSWCSADAKLNMLGCTQHQSIPPRRWPYTHYRSCFSSWNISTLMTCWAVVFHQLTLLRGAFMGRRKCRTRLVTWMGPSVFSDILKQKSRGPDTDIVSDRYLKRNTCIMLHICKCISM